MSPSVAPPPIGSLMEWPFADAVLPAASQSCLTLQASLTGASARRLAGSAIGR
jgi:hypothetical protein